MPNDFAHKKEKRSWGVNVAWIFLLILIAAFVFGRSFLYPAYVQGNSMAPDIQAGERLLVYPVHRPQRGDVVIVREAPRDHYYVKRVIATGGDQLRIDRGVVFVNRRAIDEPYIGAGMRSTDSFAEITVPADSCFVMSDNRWVLEDSREFGSIKYSWIEGKVWGVYWPLHSRRLM